MKLKSFLYTTTALSLILSGQAMGSLTQSEWEAWDNISNDKKRLILQNMHRLTSIEELQNSVTEKLSTETTKLEKGFKENLKKEVDKVEAEKKTFEEDLAKKVEATEAQLIKVVNPTAKDVVTAVTSIKDALGGSKPSLMENLTLCREAVEDSPTDPLYDQLTTISALVDKSGDPLETKINKVAGKLDGSSDPLAERVDEVIGFVDASSKKTLKETLEDVSRQINASKDSLVKKVKNVRDLVASSGDPLQTDLEKVSNSLVAPSYTFSNGKTGADLNLATKVLDILGYIGESTRASGGTSSSSSKPSLSVIEKLTGLSSSVTNLTNYNAIHKELAKIKAGPKDEEGFFIKEDKGQGRPEITELKDYTLASALENLVRLQSRIVFAHLETLEKDTVWESKNGHNKKLRESFKKEPEEKIKLIHITELLAQLKF